MEEILNERDPGVEETAGSAKQHQNRRGKGHLSTRRTGGELVIFIIVFVIFIVYAISLILPLLWMLMNSFKDGTEYAIDVVMADTLRLPTKWKFSNYVEVFSRIVYNDVTFFGMMLNSLYYIFIEQGLRLFFVAVTGYILSKYTFKGRNAIYAIAIFAMTLPIIGNTAAGVSLRASLGIYDNLLAVFFTAGSGAWGFEFLLMYAFFKSVPWDYAEAAFIDGANHYEVFFRIMLPMAMGPLSCMMLTMFIARWNEYLTPIMYLESYPTLSSGLFEYRQIAESSGTEPVFFAGALVSMLPVLALYTAFHKTIMENMLGGGIKE